MASFKFHEKNYWESSKLTNSKITPSRENHAHFISCKPPHKTHPREYFGTTLCFIQIATSVVEKSQFLSVAFHLATTVLLSLIADADTPQQFPSWCWIQQSPTSNHTSFTIELCRMGLLTCFLAPDPHYIWFHMEPGASPSIVFQDHASDKSVKDWSRINQNEAYILCNCCGRFCLTIS